MKLYGIKNCDSVKKARKFLAQHNADYEFHDFREEGLSEAQLRQWLKQQPLDVLLNKRSTTWKQLADDVKSNLDEESAIQIMLSQPTLIKRPVLEANNELLVGFKDSSYQALIK